MKKTLILAIISLCVSGLFAQEKLSFEKVIPVDSIKKNELYNGLKEWIGMDFVSAKNVIEVDDKDAGLIIVNPLKDYSFGKLQYICYDGNIRYSIKIQIKDGRFKVVVTNFMHDINPGNGANCKLGLITTALEYEGATGFGMKSYSNKVWLDLKSKCELISNDLFARIAKIDFSTSKTNNSKDNW
jgi:hypothetical protein